MANPQTPYIKDSEQRILNRSFDPTYDTLAIENLAEYNSTLVRLQADASGNLKVSDQSSSSTTTYDIRNIEDTGTYKYFGFQERGGDSWRIMRKTLATNAFDYATGTSNYATAWTNRASEEYS